MENNEKEMEEREIMTTEDDMDENNNEDRKFYVYEHIRKDNNTCFYVGKGTGDRAYNLDRGNFHNGVCKEYGCGVKIIKDGLTEEEALKLETERIEDYVITFGYGIPIDGYRDFSNNYLTNFTWGGEGISGYKFSEETKQKMSEAKKGKKHSEEAKRKISESEKGKKKSEETKQKMSESHKGKNPYANKTDEEMETIVRKMSESHEGKLAGEKHHFYGKEMSEERKQKISKKVICITTGEIFNSRKYAGYHYGISPDTISACCKGKRKSSGVLNHVPLQWKYLEDYNNEFKGILINPIIK